MTDGINPAEPSTWDLLAQSQALAGGEDLLASLRAEHATAPPAGDATKRLDSAWREFIARLQIRMGTLLKADTFSVLLGAGASVQCGGVLVSKVPLSFERRLLEVGTSGQQIIRVSAWLRHFYSAVAQASPDSAGVPTDRGQIVGRRGAVLDGTGVPLDANLERVLSVLVGWRGVLTDDSGRLRVEGTTRLSADAADLSKALEEAKRALAQECVLPRSGMESSADTFRHFLRKILTRPFNLKRANVFTLNYDTLIEQAADDEGVVLVDGFIGSHRRIFRPECYDQDLYFPAQTTEGRVHRLDKVAHLYKLHGSVTWSSAAADWTNPYGVTSGQGLAEPADLLIYPIQSKLNDSLGMPYAELFRRFATAVVRPQSTLVVIGYGFGDEHVNAIIRQALSVPSFTLVIVDPQATSDFVGRLKARRDSRVTVLSGDSLGAFDEFVRRVLPDLVDEDTRRKVEATYRSLKVNDSATDDGKESTDGE